MNPTDLPPASGKKGFVIQLTLPAMLIFSASVVLASALLAYGLVLFSLRNKNPQPVAARIGSNRSPSLTGTNSMLGQVAPWGELRTSDIELEQPEEYAAFGSDTNQVPIWVFKGMSSNAVRSIMLDCGIDSNTVAHGLSPALATTTPAGTSIKPDDDLAFAISTKSRCKLYAVLARFPVNLHMRFPFVFSGGGFTNRFSPGELQPSTVAMVQRLIYRRHQVECLSDYEIALRRVQDSAERLRLVKVLSRQSAVMVRLRIWPGTDIDKLLGYWDRGMQVKDVRPLLEAMTRLENGGSVSLLYLLPPFARERLYTFPFPSKPGDPAMDCHWSTMNFFNAEPDNRFCDPGYTARYVFTNFYQIAKPTMYGDVILVADEDNDVIHSGVYLADDLIFTKNGNTIEQPWKIMRLKDLLAMYATAAPMRTAYYRKNGW